MLFGGPFYLAIGVPVLLWYLGRRPPEPLRIAGPALAALAVLTRMILLIGSMPRDCPETGPAARLVAVTVATGFCAIGAGGVVLIAAAFPIMAQTPVMAFFVRLGLAVLCLGRGFSLAVNTLRSTLYRSKVLADS